MDDRAAVGFLDCSCFDGTGIPGPSTPPTQGGRSTFDGDLVFANLPRDVVAEALPQGLQLAANSKEPTVHPVALILAHHAELTLLVPPHGSHAIPGAYHELVLLIPFVQSTGSERWHDYAVHMYLDSPPPIWIGNLYYGYSKEFALIKNVDTMGRRDFSALPKAPPRLHFEAQTIGGASRRPTHYDEMRKILSFPILGRMAMPNGQWSVCSYWHWDDGAATAATLDGTLRFVEPFISGMQRWKDLGSIASVPEGACRLTNLRWSMAFPPSGCDFR